MKLLKFLAILLCALTATAPMARASSSAWHEAEGGRVRLVTTGAPDADGRIRGVLDIRLAPGWKTYWRDPGDAGVPPTLDLGAAGSAQLLFPAPEWHHDGTYDWAGYSSSVALPVRINLSAPDYSGPITATAFLGICKTICIPLKADFVIDLAADPDNPGDSLAVAAAEARLPEPASTDFGVANVRVDGETVTFEVNGITDAAAELFVAGGENLAFSRPHPAMENGRLIFTSKMTSYAKGGRKRATVEYTLKSAEKSVAGSLSF
ncbi:MAG: hypothetical protein M9924_02250 [Rhizobiaceae bacterium]|nr:hypothetical protein [Rhizobiaceae bacterium]